MGGVGDGGDSGRRNTKRVRGSGGGKVWEGGRRKGIKRGVGWRGRGVNGGRGGEEGKVMGKGEGRGLGREEVEEGELICGMSEGGRVILCERGGKG